MTAKNPSRQIPADGASMSFLLPAKYTTVESAPKPTDPNVTLQQLPERIHAVRTFSWNFTRERCEEELKKLVSDIQSDGKYVIVGNAEDLYSAGYNPPFTLPWMKTNEV